MKNFREVKQQISESVWDAYRKRALQEEHLLDVPTHSVEDIAKKHGVSVDRIKSQLKTGVAVEKEHTTHDSVAHEIALDHLGERPDYYSKLDKAHLEESKMPHAGHPMHRESDDELHERIQDSHEAEADAKRHHDLAVGEEYAAQRGKAQDILAYRQRGGRQLKEANEFPHVYHVHLHGKRQEVLRYRTHKDPKELKKYLVGTHDFHPDISVWEKPQKTQNESYKYGDAMMSRLPSHLSDPRVSPEKRKKKEYHVLPGHPYHHKTDAELRYIMKDAAEAEKAIGAHDKKAMWKYGDQQNDAATVLGYRQRGGKQIPEPKSLREELTPRERVSDHERLAPKKPAPVDATQELKTALVKHDNTNDNVRKNLAQGGVDQQANKTIKMNEAFEMAFNEDGESLAYKVGDRVIPKVGPHAGQVHTVIHVHDTGHLNIKPERVAPARNRYRLGAAKAHPEQVTRAPLKEMTMKPWGIRGINNTTIQEVFKAAKDKKAGKTDTAPDKKGKNPFAKKDALPDEGAKEPNKEVPGTPPPQDLGTTPSSDGGAPQPGAEKKKNNTPEPEKKTDKIKVKGPGPDDKFQDAPIVTPVTTMPDTASPKSGSQGVR